MFSMRKKAFMGMLVIVLFALTAVNVKISFALNDDIPMETGIIKQVGENFVTVVIKNGNGFKDGTKLTFHFHKKTKIVMARSKTLLMPDNLLVGDLVRITLGVIKYEKDKKTFIRYADRVEVLKGLKGKRMLQQKNRGKP